MLNLTLKNYPRVEGYVATVIKKSKYDKFHIFTSSKDFFTFFDSLQESFCIEPFKQFNSLSELKVKVLITVTNCEGVQLVFNDGEKSTFIVESEEITSPEELFTEYYFVSCGDLLHSLHLVPQDLSTFPAPIPLGYVTSDNSLILLFVVLTSAKKEELEAIKGDYNITLVDRGNSSEVRRVYLEEVKKYYGISE